VKYNIPSGIFRQTFDNAELTLYRETTEGAYNVTVKREDIATLSADVQPYSGKLAREEYGLDIERALKVFCASDKSISEGLYADIDGSKYIVQYVERQSGGTMMILERCKA
jgi:hypothetical protein